MDNAADRGGPFGSHGRTPGNWLRAQPPGIARRVRAAESSPIGSGGWTKTAAQPRKATHGFLLALATLLLAAAGKATHARLLTLTMLLLAGAGGASFGHGAYMVGKAQLAQWLLQRSWDATLDAGPSAGVHPQPWPWADTHPVARLLAPGRGVDLLVLAGASGRTLAFGPGHLTGSPLPGAVGNAIIAAHRDTHFHFLRDIVVGDELIVEMATGERRHFRVRDLAIRAFDDLALARDASSPTLTLVTCYPFDALATGGPLRLVVTAEAVG